MISETKYHNTWCEISKSALINNLTEFKNLIKNRTIIAPVIKANAYGHGLTLCGKIFAQAGAEWLCVNEIYEAKALRTAGIKIPILVIGSVSPDQTDDVANLNLRCIVFSSFLIKKLEIAGAKSGNIIPVHLKVETGTNRLGLKGPEVLSLIEEIKSLKQIELEGLCMHYADIEDTTDHLYAMSQLQKFNDVISACENNGIKLKIIHASNTAAAILWPKSYFNLIRFGIGAYGMWPSKETYITALHEHRHKINLIPALTWKTRIVQVKIVDSGEFIGYGCTYRTTHKSKIAVLPVGYYDGYDRRLSNTAHVIIRGKRAQVRGRICMNMCMVDVTDIEDAVEGDEVILLGKDRKTGETVSAEQLAGYIGTINYEITTRINERIPRIEVE